jgi:hypothetical protein
MAGSIGAKGWLHFGTALVPAAERCSTMTTNRSTSADFVTAFATGWPEKEPHLMVLSLTTHRGIQDFAFTKDQALLIAKTIKKTALQIVEPKVR